LDKEIKITVVGSGYVGMSLAVLLSKKNSVTVLDINKSRVELINKRKSTVADKEIDLFLKDKSLKLVATLNKKEAYAEANFIIIATPTNYDEKKNYFDTSSVQEVIGDAININSNALIVIKSTIPIGFTDSLQKKYDTERIIFSPEFLREGKALFDNLYPSRIVIGSKNKLGKEFSELLSMSALKKDIITVFTNSSEAEAIKLFANTYLAMRVAFFNELDSFSLHNDLNTKSIIDGVCSDERVGNYYNNPSFGYGGYCLPKDTKQLLASFEDIPNSLIKSIVDSNKIRKDFLAEHILRKKPKVVGFYRLAMKQDSDNFRDSAILGIIDSIKLSGVQIIIYEPDITEDEFIGYDIVKNIFEFKESSDIIVANRNSMELNDCLSKVFTRDVHGEN